MTPIRISKLMRELKESISIFICCSSFEDRSFKIASEITSDIKKAQKLVYYSTNEYSQIISNSKVLRKILGPKSQLIPLNTNFPVQNAIQINESINAVLKLKSNANILFDASTFTHETLLILFRLLQYKRPAFNKLFIAYVGAKGYSVKESTNTEKWLSSGISDIRTIIGFPGIISPARKNHLIVLFGFEKDRTISLIRELQFDVVSLGFGAPSMSIEKSHQELNCERHAEVMEYFSNAVQFEISLVDPFEAKNHIMLQVQKYPDHNVVIAPLNNKISTIGAGLVAIEKPAVQLIYAKPVDYNASGYSEAKDECYFYDV